jgi:hypothetical protein
MLSLETLDLLLAITEGELIEEMIIGMLAGPAAVDFLQEVSGDPSGAGSRPAALEAATETASA